MNIIDAALLGILQGITEFLPISSSGHLILAEYFFHLKGADLAFDVMLHMGTLIAVLIYFFKDWLDMLKGLLPQYSKQRRLLLYVIIGTIPGAVFGVLLAHKAETVFRNPWVIVCTLAGVAFLLLLAEKVARHTRTFKDLNLKDAILIGISQAFAIVPGVSRSGITMTTALFLNLDRKASAKFSFLLSAPIIAGAGLYEGIKILKHGGVGGLGLEYLIGFLTAAVSGYLVIAFLMRFLTTHTFKPFAYYRILLAAFVAAFLLATHVSPVWGYTTSERISMRLYRRCAPGVVNITSSSLPLNFRFSLTVPKGSCTGFIIDNRGHVVTLSHLIVDPHRLEVTLYNGDSWPATLIGCDNSTDIAVIKIGAPDKVLANLNYLLFSSSFPSPGQTVFILGDAFLQQPSFVKGSVSLGKRVIEEKNSSGLLELIELNALINTQNAGGPVLDTSGKVIGVATNQYSNIPGIGFAIPSKIVVWIAKQLIKNGYITHVWLGASLITITPSLANVMNISIDHGALVCSVIPNSPAARAGLRGCNSSINLGNTSYPMGGDIIVSFNGRPVDSASTLIDMLNFKRPGDKVLLGIYRDNRFRRVWIKLTPRPTQ